MRRACLAAFVFALVLPGGGLAAASTTELLPGATYVRQSRWTPEGPVVVHVLTVPRPGGVYDLKPVLARNQVSEREPVSSMQRRLAARATVAGVNGDFFGSLIAAPSGVFMRTTVLATTPNRNRSSVGISTGGDIRVARISHASVWTVPGFPSHRLKHLNKRLTAPGVALYTPVWSGPTPTFDTAYDVVLAGFPRATPNQDLIATAAGARRGGGTAIPPGGAVLQARGYESARILRREAQLGRTVSVRIDLAQWSEDVTAALGGGPLLVRDGVALSSTREDFTSYQLDLRHPRTAVGQLADGRIILVAVDGRSWLSIGMRTWELAAEMARLGAVTAMALDGGGSTTIAFDGRVLNRPSDGSERPVADALMFLYYGIYAPRPRYRVFSPNGDGVADVQRLSAKIVRRSTVDVSLVQPDGSVAWRYAGPLAGGVISKDLTSSLLQEGSWRWIAHAVDDRGRESVMKRRFVLNNTLGHLTLSKTRMTVRPYEGGRVVASVKLTRAADVTFSVRDAHGRTVRTLFSGTLPVGSYAIVWNGKTDAKRVVGSGTYAIRVEALNDLGRVKLAKTLFVTKES